jgi:hypothetical protein
VLKDWGRAEGVLAVNLAMGQGVVEMRFEEIVGRTLQRKKLRFEPHDMIRLNVFFCCGD